MEIGSEISAGIPVDKTVLEAEYSILSAPVSVTKFDVLYQAERAIVKLRFNTEGTEYKDIYARYNTKIKVVGDFKYRLIVE